MKGYLFFGALALASACESSPSSNSQAASDGATNTNAFAPLRAKSEARQVSEGEAAHSAAICLGWTPEALSRMGPFTVYPSDLMADLGKALPDVHEGDLWMVLSSLGVAEVTIAATNRCSTPMPPEHQTKLTLPHMIAAWTDKEGITHVYILILAGHAADGSRTFVTLKGDLQLEKIPNNSQRTT